MSDMTVVAPRPEPRPRRPRPAAAALVLAVALVVGAAACEDAAEIGVEQYLELARQSKEAGNLTTAIIQLKNAVQSAPRAVAPRQRLGEIYGLIGDGVTAEKELIRAGDLGAEWRDIAVPMGRAWLLLAKYDELLERLRAEDGFPGSVNASILALRGRALLSLNRGDDAEHDFELALVEDEGSVEALVGLARVAMRRDQRSEVEAGLSRLVETAPDDADVLLLRGDFAMTTEEFADAEVAYAHLLSRYPGNVGTMLRLARAQIGGGHHELASAQLDQILADSPRHLMANHFRALIAFETGDYQAASQHTEAALLMNDSFMPSLLLAGAANYALGHFERAHDYLRQYVGANPTQDDGRRLLVATQLQLGRFADSLEMIEDADNFENIDAAALLELVGAAALQQGNMDASGRYFQRAAEIRPNSVEARIRSGLILISGGKRDEGIAELEKAMELAPDNLVPEYAILGAHLAAKEFAKALEVARRLQAKAPDDPAPFIAAGLAYLGLGEESNALTAFEAAVAINPDHVGANYAMADIYLRRGERETARALYDDLLAKNPGHLRTLLRLAALEQSGGAVDEARILVERAMEANPGAAEGLRVVVVLTEVAIDGGLEIGDRVEDAAAEAAPGQGGEEGLDGVQPGPGCRGEVEHPARVAAEPLDDLGRLVGAVVVEHDVDDLAGRHLAFDSVEETDELLMAVALHAAADDGAVEHVEGGE